MAAEETSSHPLASAILAYGRSMGAEIPEHDEIITEVSRGSRTVVDGEVVRVGSLKFMKENHVAAPDGMQINGVGIANYVGVGSRIVGVLYAMDEVRQNVRRAINSLRYEGVGEVQMLTGDMDEQARLVAQEIGADGYRAQLLPEEKADAVLKLQTQGNGVVMVGDGINDAPALAYADVGISMGSKSTDIAMETSDVVINKDDPMTLPALRRLSSETMKIVHQNFAMVIGVNTVGLILGAELRPRPCTHHADLLRKLAGLCNNANQLAKVANTCGLANQQNVDEMVRIARRVWDLVKEQW